VWPVYLESSGIWKVQASGKFRHLESLGAKGINKTCCSLATETAGVAFSKAWMVQEQNGARTEWCKNRMVQEQSDGMQSSIAEWTIIAKTHRISSVG
jgi:hypothetical protein